MRYSPQSLYISMYLASGAPVPAASMTRYDYAARDWLIPDTPLAFQTTRSPLLTKGTNRCTQRNEMRSGTHAKN